MCSRESVTLAKIRRCDVSRRFDEIICGVLIQTPVVSTTNVNSESIDI